MKKLLILGTNNGSCEIVRYAKSQGIYTIVTDYFEPCCSKAKLEADEYWMISTAELDILEKKCKEEGINAVICGASDFNQEMTIELSSRLGLRTYCTREAWHYSRDKADFKKVCKELEVPVPKDYYVSEDLTEKELNAVVFPVMVKPIDMSGNRGISYCYNKQDLVEAYYYARSVSQSSKVIVERMIHGEEWCAYYAMADGEISLVSLTAVCSQPGEPKNCYSITTTVSKHVKRYVKEINSKVIQMLKKVGCREGFGWVQYMLDEDNHFYIIEMAYRLDGTMMFIPFRNVCNFDTIKWIVDYVLGKKNLPSELPKAQTQAFVKCGCGYMLWSNKGGEIAEINGMEKIMKIPGVLVDLLVQVGDKITIYKPLASITFDTNDCDEMCRIIEKINQIVSIRDIQGENMAIYYTDFDYIKKIYNDGIKETQKGER